MKTSTFLLTATLFSLPVSILHAETDHHPDNQNTKSSMQGGSMGNMGMMADMKQHMNKMMKQMEEIRNSKDPDVRDKLMENHMKSMQDGMKMMGGNMMGGTMMGGKEMDKSKMNMDMPKDGMGERMDMMENRMKMMQGMMNQMVDSNMESAQTNTLRKHQHKK